MAIDIFPDAPKYAFDVTETPLQMQSIPGAFDDLEQSVASVIKNINNVTASDSPLQIDIRDSLREVSKAASSVKKLTDMLEQQPQSLIFGKPSEESK